MLSNDIARKWSVFVASFIYLFGFGICSQMNRENTYCPRVWDITRTRTVLFHLFMRVGFVINRENTHCPGVWDITMSRTVLFHLFMSIGFVEIFAFSLSLSVGEIEIVLRKSIIYSPWIEGMDLFTGRSA